MKNVISNNADFLFLYDAFQCNPNGDPDQENKPRMDYDTDTNLVTDTRVKRYVRDYLRHVKNEDIFVDMEGNSKVSPDTRLKNVITTLINDEARLDAVLPEDLKKIFNDLKNKTKDKTAEQIIKLMQGEKEKADKKDDKAKDDAAKDDKKDDKSKAEIMRLNYFLLAHLVKDKFIDVRMFGSAFAIKGFTKAYTGPIQMNWGYSLHKVKIMDSSSIVTIMNDDNSTFGKDYRVHYSLLAFNGTINCNAAKSTELTTDDINTFRESLWESISNNGGMPSRSKLNQYPKLYVEIKYKTGISNGYFGDLRQYVTVTPKVEADKIRGLQDLNLDFSRLYDLLKTHKDVIENLGIYVKNAIGFDFKINN